MRIVLLGHDDIASLFAMNFLIEALPEHEFRVFLSGPLASTKEPLRELAELSRWDQRLCQRFLSGSNTQGALRSARVLSEPNVLPGLTTLRTAEPDLIVSIRYRRILHDDAIAVPRHGVLNLHSGILPGYRGVMVTFWAMLNEEPEIGMTLHRIADSGIDTGPVIEVSRGSTRADRSYLANVLSLYPDGCAMILDAIRRIDAGEAVEGTLQPVADGAYFSMPDRAALDRFRATGLTLLDGAESLPG